MISIAFALFALLVATQNLIIALFAALSIALIIVNVLAMVIYNGWQLGSSESVGVVICVGFAVDYVVHLASHFVHSKHKDRFNRTREALRELGVSIVSGSITTVVAVAVLFLCVIFTFTKFAVLVISTIVLSILYSLGFFAALCHTIGPRGDVGNFSYLHQQLFEACNFQLHKELQNSPRGADKAQDLTSSVEKRQQQDAYFKDLNQSADR